MAYDALKQRKAGKDGDNPYQGLTASPTPVSLAAPTATTFQTPLSVSQGPTSSGPTATGHVNFDSLYGANADVAQREAGKAADAAQAKAKGVHQGLTGSMNQFNQAAKAGTPTGPTGAQQYWAQNANTGVEMPKRVRGAGFSSSGQTGVTSPGANQSYITEEQEGLVSTPPPLAPTPGQPAAPPPPDITGITRDQLAAGANAKYAGPNSLSETNGYQKLLDDAVVADQSIANPVSGQNQLDSALLNAAGRPRFAQLQQAYGHSANDIEAANRASTQTAAGARAASKDAANAYQGLLDSYDQRVGADQKSAKDAFDASEKVITKAREDAINGNLNGPEGVWAKGSTQTVTGPDGQPEEVWADDWKDDAANLFSQSYEDARAPTNTTSSFWNKHFGISETDADYIRSTMTEDDYKAYQAAAQRGPTAVKNWLNSMLARRPK